MFINKIIETLTARYTYTGEEIRKYDEKIYAALTNSKYTEAAINEEVNQLKKERQNFIEERNAKLKKEVSDILNAERDRIRTMVTSRPVTPEMLSTLSLLKSLENVTQLEFDQYAESMRGVYMAERSLAEIAKARGLRFNFQPLEKQLAKVDKVESDLKDCFNYKGERTPDLIYRTDTIGEGTGKPYMYNYISKHLNQYISDYEKGNFTEAAKPQPEKSNLERLRQLQESYLDDAGNITDIDAYSKISAFIEENQSLLMSAEEIATQKTNEFIDKLTHKLKF